MSESTKTTPTTGCDLLGIPKEDRGSRIYSRGCAILAADGFEEGGRSLEGLRGWAKFKKWWTRPSKLVIERAFRLAQAEVDFQIHTETHTMLKFLVNREVYHRGA